MRKYSYINKRTGKRVYSNTPINNAAGVEAKSFFEGLLAAIQGGGAVRRAQIGGNFGTEVVRGRGFGDTLLATTGRIESEQLEELKNIGRTLQKIQQSPQGLP